MNETVVLIHGIWMTGYEMSLLGKRISEAGYTVHYFRYHSLLRTPAQNAIALNRFIQALDAEVVHLMAHSLGGIVVLHLFDLFPAQKPGRVLMLGTPLKGSAVAHAYYRLLLPRPLLGKSIDHGLLGDAPRWKGMRPLGMIAGNRGIGVGMLLLGALPKPHDGTVALEETRSVEVNQHLEAPYSHFGMLFSKNVAIEAIEYLKTGKFL